jgi:rubrerythrin
MILPESVGRIIMPVAEIAAAVTGIRSALDITKAMVGLRDAEAFRAKSIELQGVVLEALDKAIEARESYSTQSDRVRALEAEVASLKAWDADKQRYELEEVSHGAMAYVLKKETQGTEPIHWLCASCYNNGKKSILQLGREKMDPAGRIPGWDCPSCKATIFVRYDISPGKPASV